jgi:hypothetical protein
MKTTSALSERPEDCKSCSTDPMAKTMKEMAEDL